MCLFILSYLQHTNLELDKQVRALALKSNGFVNKLSQREILNFDHAWEQDKNMSHEIQKGESTYRISVPYNYISVQCSIANTV